MKLAFSTNAYKKSTLEAAIDSIARIGYEGVELMADIPHAYPPDMLPDRIEKIRTQLRARHLEISNINAFTLFAQGDTYHPTWIEDDLRLVAQRIRHTQDVIRMTAALGATTISLQPGGPLGKIPRQTALNRYEAGLHECLPLAQEHHITLLIEPEPGLLIERSDDCLRFLTHINHPNLRMNADLGHFFCVGEDPAEVLRRCAPHIAHVHLEDIEENHVHQHHLPGHGAMNWQQIFQALNDIHYQNWLTVELYPYESTAESAAQQAHHFLKDFLPLTPPSTQKSS